MPSSNSSRFFPLFSRSEPKPCEAKRVTRFGHFLQSIIPLWALPVSSINQLCLILDYLFDIPFWPLSPLIFFSLSYSFRFRLLAIMADITAVGEENPSPTQDELQQAAAGNGAPDNRTPKRRMSDDEEDEEKQGRERRKIEIKFIQDKSRRHITFSKRKAGIMKKVRRVPSPLPRPPPPFSPHRMSPSSVLLGLRMLTGRVSRASRHTSCPSSPEPRCCCWSCRRPASSTPSPLPSSSRW